MKKIFFLGIWVMILGIACSDNERGVYSSDNYIYFENDTSKITSFTFFFTDATEAKVGLAMKIIAPVVPENRTYSLRFVAGESTAKPDVDFRLPAEKQIFKGNLTVDTLSITLLKAPTLEKGDEVKAVFELLPEGDFIPAMKSNTKAIVLISNKVSQPDWWDDWHITSGLGEYSDTKYGLFVKWTGVSDLDFKNREDLTQSDVRALILKFKYMLKENPQMDENGPMTVAMRG